MNKLTKEEMLYEDALDIVEKSIQGQHVNRNALSTAIQLIQFIFVGIGDRRMAEAKEEEKWAAKIDTDE